MIQEALLEAVQKAHENRLEDKDLDELHELEDEEDEEFLEQYRKRRLAELSSLQKKSVYGQVFPLQKPDYARDVTEESNKAYVLVNLTSSLGTNVESRVLSELWRQAAAKFGDVKFCEIRANLCIEGYPEKNTPTILIYKDGDIKRQLVTLRELNGPKTSLKDIENVLVEVGAIKENDMRLKRREDSDDENYGSNSKNPAGGDDDDDDDWD
ncbi:Proteolipid protein 2 [Exophiala dermatitidis]|nr:Proteolipid protein 2 [Exophiala dermatitidis]KAJ4577115.1 Proteolipid protein 2 [Exophiala dermatitidis]KAJ4627332.1 Proteolipid protein 2 [Exophiala dermatitidis]KAJ4656190.1 Proteolipid protein 2 [Exophiala dermatitidis]KAJ4683331.1 Proteolipid protein 2 [Exophiala dermatitidis]